MIGGEGTREESPEKGWEKKRSNFRQKFVIMLSDCGRTRQKTEELERREPKEGYYSR